MAAKKAIRVQAIDKCQYLYLACGELTLSTVGFIFLLTASYLDNGQLKFTENQKGNISH